MRTSYATRLTRQPFLIAFGLAIAGLALLAVLPVHADEGAPRSTARADAVEKAAASLTIPEAKNPVVVDGRCDPASPEYSDALMQTFMYPTGFQGRVYLKHDAHNLYVCMVGMMGGNAQRFAGVYLDTDNGKEVWAEADDLALQAWIVTSANQGYIGTGVQNGYVPMSLPGWFAKTSTGNFDLAEYSIPLQLTGGLCGKPFGMAVHHLSVNQSGDDYGWPDKSVFDQPQTWQEVTLQNAPCQDRGRIAYVYRGDDVAANAFQALLVGRNYSVTLVPLGMVLSTDFSAFDLILIADDTGSLDQWGSAAGQVAQITKPNKPILGIGEGGYAFFGKLSLFIGWPRGWHGPQNKVIRAAGAPLSYYSFPNPIPPDPVQVYGDPVNEVGIYLGGDPKALPLDLVPIGLEPPTPDHASLIMQGCRQLWGFSENPKRMTGTGQDLFANAVEYNLHFQCRPEPPPPTDQCVSIKKEAVPAGGTVVHPGDIITYKITYLLSDNPACQNGHAKLTDSVPLNTTFVPGSASDGISPAGDGTLTWDISPAPGPGVKTFKVRVSDTACREQKTISNRAGLILDGYPPLISNVVTHPVECPAVTFPNDQPPYAEDEVQIYPYPLITGTPSDIQVKLRNDTGAPLPVTVKFQTSPDRFGIGLDFNTFDTKMVVIPAHSNVIVHSSFTPVSSGHYCIQIVVQAPGMQAVTTQRNLDVTEDLRPGVTDKLDFKVRNNSSSTANINLVVINTCPGWTAVVVPAVLTAMAPGEVRTAQLQVTPPNPAVLGTGCHIDVQAWIGNVLIGGIRKLDVPPVQLPHAEPSWMEKEIVFQPDPPVVGQPGQVCIRLQNPLPAARVVTVDFSWAAFGAGIGFTPLGTLPNITLPPNSNNLYCINWTPTAIGPGDDLHRCILVKLSQDGWQDQYSQRNVDLVHTPRIDLGRVRVPVLIGNPDPVPHELQLRTETFGIDPYWQVEFMTPEGGAPPTVLMGDGSVKLYMELMPAMTQALNEPAAPPPAYQFGDESRVEVGVVLDGKEVGGFSVQLQPPWQTFLPLIWR
jgi:uncharacterized repeat protein (TIGR01451 family)